MTGQKSVFANVLTALRKGRRGRDVITPKQVLTGTQPAVQPQSSTEQKQQAFLDIQYQKIAHDLYSRSVYYDTDRIGAYNDYRAMDMSPEISAALDIITDECVTRGDKGEILSIYSSNERVKKVLKDMFFNILNIEYNLSFWIRELIKFGDTFLLLEIDKKQGIFDVRMLPVAEIHREEAFDGNMNSARFRWDINNMYFEEWQVAHFRLINDGTRIPYGRCLKSDTYIETENGFEFIKDIKKGDTVYSFDLKTQEKVKTKVLDTVCSGQKEIYKIRTRNNEIESSIEHNFLVCENAEFKYKSVSELKNGDLFVINKNTETNNKVKINKTFPSTKNYNGYRNSVNFVPEYITKDFAKLFGFMLGDGWIARNNVCVALGVDEDINNKYINLLEKFSGKKIRKAKSTNPLDKEIESYAMVGSRMLREVLTNIGFKGKCYEKIFPKWIYECSPEIQEAFIEGLIDSDGSIFIDEWNCKRYSFEVTSKYLVKDFKFLLQRLGRKSGKICERQRKDTDIKGKSYKKRRCYYFYFYDSFLEQKKKYEISNRLMMVLF